LLILICFIQAVLERVAVKIKKTDNSQLKKKVCICLAEKHAGCCFLVVEAGVFQSMFKKK